eukprot:3252424-Rhodomonas_salina.7
MATSSIERFDELRPENFTLRYRFVLSRLSANPQLQAKIPQYRTQLGFGLHMGWAIEGAIGTVHKLRFAAVQSLTEVESGRPVIPVVACGTGAAVRKRDEALRRRHPHVGHLLRPPPAQGITRSLSRLRHQTPGLRCLL